MPAAPSAPPAGLSGHPDQQPVRRSAGNGGFYAQLPEPTGANNHRHHHAGDITATDAGRSIRQGDLLLTGTVRSWNDDVTLNATNGSIWKWRGVGGGMPRRQHDVFLMTATGAIGGCIRAT